MAAPGIEDSYRRRRLVLAVLCLSVLLTVVSNMALNVALPTLGRQLHAGPASLAWVVDAYVLCFAGLLLPAGALGDRFGRKGALQCGLALYVAAAVCGAFSTRIGELIAARAVMGIGAAFVMPGTLSLLATVFPPAQRPKAIAVWAGVAGGSVAISITWSGYMLEHFWWGAIFLGMALVGVVALVAGRFLLPTSRHPGTAGLDPVGALLCVVGASGLLYGFIQAPDDGWTAAPILGAFALGGLGAAAFVAWERRHPHPMLDPGFFAERRLSIGALSIAAAYFALFGMYFVLTQYLQSVCGYSPLAAGLYALPAGLAQLAIANAAKPLVARHGFRPVLVAGLAASTTGLVLLADAGGASPIWIVEVGLGLLGAGIGLTMPPAAGAVMSALPSDKAGVGSAVNDLARELGGAFGIGVLGSVTLSRYRAGLAPGAAAGVTAGTPSAANQPTHIAALLAARDAYSSGFDIAMLVGALLVAAAGVAVHLALCGERKIRVPQSRPVPDSEPIR